MFVGVGGISSPGLHQASAGSQGKEDPKVSTVSGPLPSPPSITLIALWIKEMVLLYPQQGASLGAAPVLPAPPGEQLNPWSRGPASSLKALLAAPRCAARSQS